MTKYCRSLKKEDIVLINDTYSEVLEVKFSYNVLVMGTNRIIIIIFRKLESGELWQTNFLEFHRVNVLTDEEKFQMRGLISIGKLGL